MKVFLHGWGMRKEMFSSFIDAYYSDEDILSISLPGYDECCDISDFDAQVVKLSTLIPEGAHLIAWSLGGLFALRLAELYPQLISRITMICSTPNFVKKEDWSFGLEEKVLTQFGADLLLNRQKTIAQFMLLQLHGQKNIKPVIKAMNKIIKDNPSPSIEILRLGLEYLRLVDLRSSLKSIKTKVCFIFGGKDRIVLSSQASALEQLGSHVSVNVIKAAGHMPFLTHKEQVKALL